MNEDRNEMVVTLKVPYSDYKNESIQKLFTWGKAWVHQDDYYRDIAVYVQEAEDFERTIVFTHAEISLSTEGDTAEDFAIITVAIHQKRDKLMGVMFGDSIEETYQKAWKRVMNPPRPFVVPPSMPVPKAEFAPGALPPSQVIENFFAGCTPTEKDGKRDGNDTEYVRDFKLRSNQGEASEKDNGAVMYEEHSINVEYTINTTKPWIYCNYPEDIKNENLGKAQHSYICVNKQLINSSGSNKTKEGQIFYSHVNKLEEPFRFGILISYLTSDADIKVTNYCEEEDDSGIAVYTGGKMWENFFRGEKPETDSSRELGKSVAWLVPVRIITRKVFSGCLRFEVQGKVEIALVAFQNDDTTQNWLLNRLNLDEIRLYPYELRDPVSYSGLGNGYMYQTNRIKLSSLDAEWKKYDARAFPSHYSNYREGDNAKFIIHPNGETTTDLIPLALIPTADGQVYIAESKPENNGTKLGNVGNWCAQYLYNMALENPTNETVVFDGYIRIGSKLNQIPNNPVVICYKGQVKYAMIRRHINKNKGEMQWHWLRVTLPPHTTAYDITHQFILGTNASIYIQHIWTMKIINNEKTYGRNIR